MLKRLEALDNFLTKHVMIRFWKPILQRRGIEIHVVYQDDPQSQKDFLNTAGEIFHDARVIRGDMGDLNLFTDQSEINSTNPQGQTSR